MEIKFKLLDFNKNDLMPIFMVAIYVVFFYLYVSENDIKFFFSITLIFLILLRFFPIYYLKKKIKISILEDKIKIKSFFYEKEILYTDIENLIIKKNYLGSYDILVNFNDSKYMFKYLSNYIFNISLRKNDAYSFVICDVKNIYEIENYMLEKINFEKMISKRLIKSENLYTNCSLFDLFSQPLVAIFFILWVFNFSLENMLLKYLIFYIIFINIKFFKKTFFMEKLDYDLIKISKKKNRCYIFSGYEETDKELKIDYGLGMKFNYYYLSFGIFPIKYKKNKRNQ